MSCTRISIASVFPNKTSVRVHGFNVNNNQVSGSGDNLSEQAMPVLQVEDIREATGGEMALLESRDHGFFTVDVPNFWERPEMRGLLRDVNLKPNKYAWVEQHARPALLAPPSLVQDDEEDGDIRRLLEELRDQSQQGSTSLKPCPSARMGMQAEQSLRGEPAAGSMAPEAGRKAL